MLGLTRSCTYEVQMVPVPNTCREASVRIRAGMETVDVRDRLDGIVRDVHGGTGLPGSSASRRGAPAVPCKALRCANTHHTTAKVGSRFAFHSRISCSTAWSYSAARASILRRVQSPNGPGSIAHEHSTGRCGSGGRWVLVSAVGEVVKAYQYGSSLVRS